MMADPYIERWRSGTLRCTAEGVWIIESPDGHVRWTSAVIIPGTPYGRLTIIEATRPHWLVGIGGGVQPRVRVRCKCGRELEVYWNGLRGDHGPRDCGCAGIIEKLTAFTQIVDLLDDETLDAIITDMIDDADPEQDP
jgi:hypothetical protein